VRGKTVDAIREANKKVNRALNAGAMAVGAKVEINDMPGYMPYHKNPELEKILTSNCVSLVGKRFVKAKEHSTGSTDLGDISCIMPTTSVGMGGGTGTGHGRTMKIVDPMVQYVLPAKAIALTCIDLLYDNASLANKIIKGFKPTIPPENYTEFMKKLVK
jgi:metal-dependent amidase/aminoacylase/carboxypeptidase family protein